MQKFTILLNTITNNNTTPTQSNLKFEGNYYAYNQSSLNQGIVTEFNVNQFLDNPNNEFIAKQFYDFLIKNTSNSELQEISNSDKKLSDTFKDFYTSFITRGQTPTASKIDNNLTGTTKITTTNYNYQLSDSNTTKVPLGVSATIIAKNRIGNTKEVISTFIEEDSFYLPIKIELNGIDLSRIDFSEFAKDCFREVNGQSKFLAQSFVDLNKNNDPNSFWTNY